MMTKLFPYWFLFLLFFSISSAFASHLRGGQITFRLIDCPTNTYEISVTIYTNTQSQVEPGNGVLNYGDGMTFIVPTLSNETSIDPVNSVGMVTYVVKHTYASHAGFTVSYTERNRNAGVMNMQSSATTPFSIESFILANGNCDQPMIFTIPPTDRACSGLAFTHNPGTVAPADDSISYQLVTPLAGPDILVSGFQNPNSTGFYSGNYQQANEAHTGPPTLQISSDGTLTWDAPGNLGEYAVDIKVLQWKLIDSIWVNTGWVIRDMQVLVENCNASRPFMSLPADLCVHPGDNIQMLIRGHDSSSNPVTIQVFTVDNFYSSQPDFINTNVLQSTQAPYDTASIKIAWKISCDEVRQSPYKFIFKISNYLQNGVRLSSFQTWSVNVTGQAPVYQSLVLDVAKKNLTIKWSPYLCTNASTVEVYRRVDHDSGTAGDCQTGIPRSWGFSKIGESSADNFTDTHLAPGATYCYRLLAIYQTPNHALSVASRDTCIGPLIIDAPVITNVSVNQTDPTQGVVMVRWVPPLEINRNLFPPPYQYLVQRTKDSVNYLTVSNSNLMDTTFADSKLNVSDSVFGYRVIVYSPSSIAGNNPIDTSALAFYPRLSYQSLVNGIKLIWDAAVPWSNQSPRYPWHYIYRKERGSSKFLLMDSVNIDTLTIPTGYEYYDLGNNSGYPINPNSVYAYKVETQGVYGNPKIHEPLQNLSNEISAQPIDKMAPCAPQLSVQTVPCEILINSLPCTVNDYKNTISWTPAEGCGDDVAYYKIFFTESTTSDTTLLTMTTDLTYVHHLPNSLAGCYQVSAIDRSGNIGELSSKNCVENCTHFFMPNMISANGDGMNETFPDLTDQTEVREPFKCPRFVKEISVQIFNRWGREVFSIDGPPGTAEWRGLDQNGRELSSGVYYYAAKVFYYSLHPENESQNFTGSVSLFR
jgi:hypothetical protein